MLGLWALIAAAPWTISPLAWSFLIITLILTTYHFYQINTRIYKLAKKIPGPASLPIIGNALLVIGKGPNEVIEILTKALELCGKMNNPVMRGFLGPKVFIFLIDPKDVEIILSSHVHIEKSREYRFFKPWLGNGLLISTGEKWRAHRKLIAPAFHINIVKRFMDRFNDNSRNVVEQLLKEIGKTFDVHDYLAETTVDILLETAMGISRKKTDSSAGFKYAMAVIKMCHILHERTYNFWLRFDTIFNLTKLAKKQKQLLNTIHGLTRKVIKYRKDQFLESVNSGTFTSLFPEGVISGGGTSIIIPTPVAKPKPNLKLEPTETTSKTGIRDDLDDLDENDVGEKKRLAFLDLLIETSQTGSVLSDKEIQEQVDTIMFEGHDTTAGGSSFLLCLLGIHQDIQDRVHQELYSIFGDSDRPATFADTLEMKYLERVIMETLRMYPPVPLIARNITQEVKLATKDYIIPPGCTVVIGTYKIHRNPEIYPNPNVFDPDNFLPERCQERHYYSYIPFSAGPRSCVGRKYAMLKLKVLLSTILRNFKMKSDLTEKDFQLQADIILKRTDGFRLQIEPRKLATAGN